MMGLQAQLQELLDEATEAAVSHGGLPQAEVPSATAGAEALVGHRGRVIAHARSGTGVLFAEDGSLLPEGQCDPISGEHLWEIASITKTVVALAALVQVDREALDLDAAVAEYLPEFDDGARRRITVRQLMNHTAGLPAVAEPWRITGGRDERAAYLLTRPLDREPGSAHVYSCLGYITLGLALERITGSTLPDLVAETVTGPLAMDSTGYAPLEGRPVAATEYDTKTGRGLVRGEVHDEAAAALGGAGNAGLFSDAQDLLRLGEEVRTGGRGLLSPQSRSLLWTGTLWPQEVERVGYNQSLGFRMGQKSFMGTADQEVIGHTGFVGTSLVIDPRQDLVVVLLTNRVHPHRETFASMPLRRAVIRRASLAVPGAGGAD